MVSVSRDRPVISTPIPMRTSIGSLGVRDQGSEWNKDFTSTRESHTTYWRFLTRAHIEKDRQFRRLRNVNLTASQTYTEFSQGLLQRQFRLTELPPLPNDSWFWSQLSAPALKTFTFDLPGVSDTALPTTVRVSLHGRSNTPHLSTIWLNDKNPI